MKQSINIILSILTLLPLAACGNKPGQEKDVSKKAEALPQTEEIDGSVAFFASGCFWCVEAVFQSVKGVKDAVSGYAGGEKANPTYEEVSRGLTKHAEAVKVIYDSSVVDFPTLIKVFFGSHDPTTLNRQGPDRGAQYRSIAFYTNQTEKELIEKYIKQLTEEKVFNASIVTEVEQFDRFWRAEEYHQEYEQNHPENPYVQSVSIPRLKRFQAKFPELLKENH